MRISEGITIDRPPPDIWQVIADPATHPHWRPAVKEFTPLTEGPVRVGTQIREVLEWRGREVVLTDEVTKLDEPRVFGAKGGWKAAAFHMELRLEPSPGGTDVTFDWTLQPKSLLMRVAAPFLKGTFQRTTAEELEGLKRYAEAGPG